VTAAVSTTDALELVGLVRRFGEVVALDDRPEIASANGRHHRSQRAERRPVNGALERRLTRVVPHEEVRGAERLGVDRAGHGNAVPLVSEAAEVLHGGEETSLHDFEDRGVR